MPLGLGEALVFTIQNIHVYSKKRIFGQQFLSYNLKPMSIYRHIAPNPLQDCFISCFKHQLYRCVGNLLFLKLAQEGLS